jgi:hypothetical protein
MARRDALESVGGYRSFPAAPDYDLLFRLIDAGHRISNIQEPLVQYRINNQSITNRRAFKQKICVQYIRKLHQERKQSGEDSFSEEVLQRNIADSRGQEKKLEKAHAHFLDAVAAKGEKKWPKVLISLLKSAFASALQRKLFMDYARAKWVKQTWRWFGQK